MRLQAVAAGLLLASQPVCLLAQDMDKYHVTPQEKSACTTDAIRFCMHTYPDEDQLLACMKQNRASLSAPCRTAFDAGVKRRRL